MIPRFWIFLFAVLSFSSSLGSPSPTSSRSIPPASVAVSDDIWSIQLNPAGLGTGRNFQLYYLHSYSDSSYNGDNALFFSFRNLGFSTEWINSNPVNYRKYTLAYGNRLNKKFFWGTSYSWFGSSVPEYDKLSSWSLGFLYRPLQHLSLGFKASDLNRPDFFGQRQKVTLNSGIAGRFFQDRLTYSFDVSLLENQVLSKSIPVHRIEFEPVNGLVLSGQLDEERNFGVGLRINFPLAGIGNYNFQDKKGKFTRGVNYIGISKDRYRTQLQRKNNLVELTLSGEIPEEIPSGLFAPRKKTVWHILRQIDKAGNDPTVYGISLKIYSLNIGWGKIQEIRQSLIDFSNTGKTVIAYLEDAGTKEYYLASAADVIVMIPTGALLVTGLSAEVTFLKGTLEKLGIVADLEHIGDYKTASDILTRQEMSETHREMANWLLDDVYSQILEDISSDRGWEKEEAQAKLEGGPYTAKRAQSQGLVDRLAFVDELEKIAKELSGKKVKTVSEKNYFNRTGFRTSWATYPKIALIYATGGITSGESGQDFLFGKTMGSNTISRAIRKARQDREVKAIVFRIDSPGGSGIASDAIWREIMLAKEKKPFIVSMSDVAASGGYFIACPGDVIITQKGTLTGSIGVISGKFNLRGLYDKIGVKKEVLKRGERSDIDSDYRGFTEDERKLVQGLMEEFYTDFVDKVASGRKISFEAVDSVARGRVWTGNQAKENGLVDGIGGLNLAIALAKEKAGISRALPVEIMMLPERRGLFGLETETLSRIFSGKKTISDFFSEKFLYRDNEALYLMPYEINFK